MKRTLLLATLLLAGCGDEGPPQYIKFAGGGIQFNYRYSQASFVAIAQQTQALPKGGTVEALFDIPNTNARQSVKLPVIEGSLSYRLQSDFIKGLKKDGRYNVTLRVLDATGKELDHRDRVFVSDQDQAELPDKPLAGDLALTPQFENLK